MRYLAPLILVHCLCAPVGANDYVIPEAKKDHWAWQAPRRPAMPVVRDKSWIKNPIDAFVLARLEAEGLKPASRAGREQLLRRVTFDLIGLPPTPAEMDTFLKDASPAAWEKVIDRLLASPHHGERWGRHWLDLARYAESNGYEFDEVRPDAWRYRDYVIEAFNSDKPFDRFIKEQIAGDELFPDDPQALIATGFNLLGPDMTDSSNQAQRRQNTLDDMTDGAGLVFLGLTVGCARCHDHKFEPIPQRDFYRLQAFFAPAVFRKDLPVASPERIRKHERAQKEYQELIGPTTGEIARLEAPYRRKLYEARFAKLADAAQVARRTPEEKRTPAQRELVDKTARLLRITEKEVAGALSAADQVRFKELEKELRKFDSRKPEPLPTALGIQDGAKNAKTVLLRRGELSNPGDEVQPGFPLILSPGFAERPAKVAAAAPRSTGRRSALAAWLASKDNPLTARVAVNRLWQHHFGRGIVATASDFGIRGKAPTHPELLDWLAVEFIERGWSLKQMHKLMLLSAAYQQSTQPSKEASEKDPKNELFSRMNRLRLEGEIIRDSLLAVSGRLNRKMGGPGVLPPLPPEYQATVKEWKASADAADHVRRSVYIFARRNLRFPFLETFDLPDSNLSCPKRERSTTAPQALALLNAADVVAAARALAERLENEARTTEERVALGFCIVLGRRPGAAEMSQSREFLSESPLSEWCRALFNVNEFVYLD